MKHRRAAAVFLAAGILFAGAAGTAVIGRCRQTLGQGMVSLPRVSAGEAGLTLLWRGEKYLVPDALLRRGLSFAGRAEPFLPRGLRMAGLGAVWLWDVLEEAQRQADGGKISV